MNRPKINEIYKHYKGNKYKVLGIANHSETLQEMVVYQALYGEMGVWVRPLSMWSEEVSVDGKKTIRVMLTEEKND